MPHELRPPPTTATPVWETHRDDPDLNEAAQENTSVATWLDALSGLGETTLSDSGDEILYSRAPDALRQQSIEPTPDAIEDWVQAHRNRPPT